MVREKEIEGTESLRYRKRHALVVGINHYKVGPFGDLSGPNYDAAEVAATLAGRFGFERVHLLVDQAPSIVLPDTVQVEQRGSLSRSLLRDRLQCLHEQVGPQDALFLYYAGHGYRSGTRGYVVPADGDPAHPETLLDLAELAGHMRSSDAHHTLLVLDCCFSGVALETSSGVEEAVGALEERSLGMRTTDNLGRVFNRRSFQVITAGTGKEAVGDLVRLSREYADLAQTIPEYQGHSPFTAVLLQAMRGLTGLPDGRLLASDLGYHMGFTLVADERIGARQAPRYRAWAVGKATFCSFRPSRCSTLG